MPAICSGGAATRVLRALVREALDLVLEPVHGARHGLVLRVQGREDAAGKVDGEEGIGEAERVNDHILPSW